MKVKIIKSYFDKELKKEMKLGEVLEITKERADLLIYKKLVKEVVKEDKKKGEK